MQKPVQDIILTDPPELEVRDETRLKDTEDRQQREQMAEKAVTTRIPFSIRTKIVLFLTVLLTLLVTAAALTTATILRNSLTNEFTSKGQAIAQSLSRNAVDVILTRDPATVQTLIDDLRAISGVGYIVAAAPDSSVFAHTLWPYIPAEINAQVLEGLGGERISTVAFTNPVTGAPSSFIDISEPILGGQLGVVHVGMNRDLIIAQANQTAAVLALLFGAAGIIAIFVGAGFGRRLSNPVKQLVVVSERVGRGDLSQLARVRSNDEIGLLANTFNQSIVQLRDLVQTREDRDTERQRREELQRNIGDFLDVATEISQGDFTRRGAVTADVLGNVVDAINVMVEELAYLLRDVQGASGSVYNSSSKMISTTDEIVKGTELQALQANRARADVVEVVHSIREMAQNAEASADAARLTLAASQEGQQAVTNTLNGMQGIRREVQAIAKRIKSLGDRSLEISEIVETISRISSQTNLLALNAAIEAAGAGEAGARFAVVADEVRRLAEDSATATQRIASLIKNVQAEVQEVVGSVEDGTREVESGYAVASATGERLREIGDLARRSAGLAQLISEATLAQVGGVEQVGDAVESIAGLSDRSQTTVLQSRALAEELQQLVQQLDSSLARFRLT